MKDCTDKIDHTTDENCFSTTDGVHCKTSPATCQLSESVPPILKAYINEPNTAPPENVALIAPMIGDVLLVSKNERKLGDPMTIVITPESYPKRKLMKC